MISEPQVLQALRDCYDPDLPLNIVELGLVERIVVEADPHAPGSGIPGVPERASVAVILLPSTRDDSLEAQLAAFVSNRLAGLPEIFRIDVRFALGPLWTPARITASGRRTLGLDKPQFPILNNRVR